MWVRKRIDIKWSDLVFGMVHTFSVERQVTVQRRVEQQWSAHGDALACLSIRTGFDLLLDVLNLPPKSEVLMSAVTIHDMVRIVEHHELVPVPIDLDMRRLAPKADMIRRAMTPKTRAIVVAHLFGSRVPMEPILEIARQHRLIVIEDCAQAFAGDGYHGHPQSDVAMFSFGPIKTATALGGAVFSVPDKELLGRLRDAYGGYPVQSRMAYFRRLLKYAVIKVLSTRWFLGGVARACRLFGQDHDGLANRVARGFAGSGFFQRIRKQPSSPLLAVLERRLRRFDQPRLQRRLSLGRALCLSLDGSVARPGDLADSHSHWVFPIEVPEPRRLMQQLWRAGFDATQGQSHCVIPPPSGRSDLTATEAKATVDKIVFLPFAPEMPANCLQRMAAVVRSQCLLEVPSQTPSESKATEVRNEARTRETPVVQQR